MHLVVIGFSGFAGAIARFFVDGFVSDRSGGGSVEVVADRRVP